MQMLFSCSTAVWTLIILYGMHVNTMVVVIQFKVVVLFMVFDIQVQYTYQHTNLKEKHTSTD